MKLLPKIFIGSSKEGLKVAEKIKNEIEDFSECKLWPDSFALGTSNFDNLYKQVAFYDYAILIATGDDIIESRGKIEAAPRDNVLFEFGLFVGGLGHSKVILITEQDIKMPSDLLGLTLLFLPKPSSETFESALNESICKLKNHIINKENTFDLGFLPSTALAYGYFSNFVEKTVERLLEDKEGRKEFLLINNSKFIIRNLKFSIIVPTDLSYDMFKKVKAKKINEGWQKFSVDSKHSRDYNFFIDVTEESDGELHVVDIPLTLNSLNMAVQIYSQKQHLGKSVTEELLEYKEIRNFIRTLEYLIENSAIARGIVKVEMISL